MWDMNGGVRMRLSRALKRGRWLSLLAAGIVGYAVGNWHAIALRAVALTASQNIALRFPEANADPLPTDVMPSEPARVTNAIILGDTSAVLLSPAPMIASAVQKPFVPQTPAAQGQVRIRVFVLNDVQIASIKSRLHLSPDQEQMWPAVEAALRTIAYSKSRDGRRKGGATSTEVASLDPYGPEVQGLKSAAFPLIMSFSDEQRSEVRGIAHVMGLDQLASQL
jgi:hypothetical protein